MIVSRVKYYITKLKRARADGTLFERINRKLVAGSRAKLATTLAYAKLDRDDKRMDADGGYADHRDDKASAKDIDRKLIAPLIDAYELAKEEQTKAPKEFEIRGLWAEWIEINYGPLIQAVRSRAYKVLNELLS